MSTVIVPIIVAIILTVGTITGGIITNRKLNVIHVLVNSKTDDLKKEISELKIELADERAKNESQ